MVEGTSAAEQERTVSVPASPERTLWVIGSTADAFAGVRPVLESVLSRFPRIDVIYTARDPDLVPWLRGHVAEATVVPRPRTLALASARAVRQRNPRLVLLLNTVAPFEAGLLRAASRRQIPVALLAIGDTALVDAPSGVLDLVERFIALDDRGADALKAVESVASRVVSAVHGDHARAAVNAADALLPMLRRDLKVLRSEQRPWGRAAERLAVAAVDRAWTRPLANGRAERIAALGDLAAQLGHPRTILCLGNGPSSEDPRLRGIAYDALFRVNHLWQARGFLTDPDVVFTGSTDTVRRMKRAIVGVSTIRHEGRILLTGFTRVSWRRFRFFTVERLGILRPEPWWGGAVPTNGALMLATAVALRPERIVVAGMDLFRHQSGAYPGDTSTANAYTSRHESNVEERILLTTLEAHRGEVEIIGDVLRGLWEEHQRAVPPRAPVVDAPADCAIGP
jgi:hypothetical protein